jgi:hypothetical protein
VVEVEHCHVGLGHAHVQRILPEYQGSGPQKSCYAPSAIMSFASLDIYICAVEYDVSFAQGKHNVKE